MTNDEARELLVEYAEAASRAVVAATWAEAFLLEGGEPTWDAVKSVSDGAELLRQLAEQVQTLRVQYVSITP